MSQQNAIKITRININENIIHVSSESTIYINEHLLDCILNYTPENLLALYKKTLSKLKEKGVNVKHKNKILNQIKELNKVLPELIENHIQFFREHSEQWKLKIEKGLFSPTVEDDELNQLYKGNAVIRKCYNRTHPIGQFCELYYRLKDELNKAEFRDSNHTIFF